jgi:enterochelin esterase-like enzyme
VSLDSRPGVRASAPVPGAPERARRRTWPRALAGLAAVAFIAFGGAGVYRYVHAYWLYRGFPPPTTPRGVAPGRLEHVRLWSPSLHQHRQYLVYLPPGYARAARSGRRFGAMYLLHAPPGRPDGFFLAGAMGVRSDLLIARHAIRPMLLVVPYGKTPAFHSDTEWADARAGRYMGFVTDVVHDVDRRFATIADRRHRAIAGLSEGGYGAINVGLHDLGTFGVVQSWSGYFDQTPTGPFAGLPPATVAANSPARYVGALAPRIRRLGLHVWLYQGLTDFIAPWRIQRFAGQLFDAGADVRFGYFGGGHDWGLWRRQVTRMLVATSRWFAEPAATAAARRTIASVGRPLPHALWVKILFDPRRRCTIKHPPRGFHYPRKCKRFWRLHPNLRPPARHRKR